MVTEYTFTPTGGRPVIFASVHTAGEPCVDSSIVTSVLDAWKAVDPDARKFLWPVLNTFDDECTIAYAIDGQVFMQTWVPVINEEDMYSLNQLELLLPANQFTLVHDDA